MAGRSAYYRGVRGSASLATLPLRAVPAAESIEPGEMRRLPYGGELLGAVRVRAGYAAIPFDVFDEACASLEAEEQAAYLQLLRLSVGEGRNWCRAGKRELEARLRLSERRLLRVLDALAGKGLVRPLHRDNRGTLWRVYLPREARGEPLGDAVLVGRASELRIVRAGRPPTAAAPARGGSRPSPAVPRAVPAPAELARALAEARGVRDPEAIRAAEREVAELLAEGQSPLRIATGIETIRRRAARARAHAGETP